MKLKTGILLVNLLWLNVLIAGQSWPPKSWTQTVEPFNIVGPIYYVGGQELTSYLITGNQGHILVNVGLAENAQSVMINIKKLGFKLSDIKFILVTQAHFDHAGGVQEMVEHSGAEVLVGSNDYAALVSGGMNDYAFADKYVFSPVSAQNTSEVVDQEVIRLGELEITVISTPGHTPGSTSFMIDIPLNTVINKVLFMSSVTISNSAIVHNNPLYPDLITEYHNTLEKLSAMHVDYVMTDHIIHAKPDNDAAELNRNWFKGDRALNNQINTSAAKFKQRIENININDGAITE